MYQPEKLKSGDKVAIVSPAGKIDNAHITKAVNVLKSYELEPILGKNIVQEYHRFAGTDVQRLADFQQALDDPAIKAIWCSRGGYGTIRIINQLNFDLFLRHPKWIIGFSDITILHAYLNNILQIKSLHAIMPLNLDNDKKSLTTLIDTLTNKMPTYKIESHILNQQGVATGQLWGGNLSILYSLRGTNLDFEPEGKILFIEDVGENLHHLDRMMHNFKMGGKLSALRGIIVGGMTDITDKDTPFGKSAYEIVLEAVQPYNYPVCFNFPAGHIYNNYALVLGKNIELNVSENNVTLQPID